MTTFIFDEVLIAKFILDKKNWLVFHTCKIIIFLVLCPYHVCLFKEGGLGLANASFNKKSYDIITSLFMLASFCSLRVKLATQSSVCESRITKSFLRHT